MAPILNSTLINMTTLGAEVPLGSINKELKALIDNDTSRTNACMMNFAVFTENANHLEANSAQIAELTRNHSCRALSVALDRHADERSITSWVTAHCNMSNGKKSVCCEQLSFLLKGYVSGRLRNTVFANLNSDLPLIFWWQGELTDVFEPRLYTLIDRFIFDSEEWSDPKTNYAKLRAAADDVQRRFVIQDLAWTRSYFMRLAFAAIFDEATAESEFSQLNSVSIQVGEGYRTTGLLLLAWLARQAGWTLTDKTESHYAFTSSEGVEISAHLSEEGDIPLAELGVASESASFLVQQQAGDDYLTQVISCPHGTHQLTSSAGSTIPVDLVADQLSRGGKNALLLKTLPLFLELV